MDYLFFMYELVVNLAIYSPDRSLEISDSAVLRETESTNLRFEIHLARESDLTLPHPLTGSISNMRLVDLVFV